MAVLRASGYGPFPLPPYDPYRRNPRTYSYMRFSDTFVDLADRAELMGADVTASLDVPTMDDLHDGRFGLVLLNAAYTALEAPALAIATQAWLSGRAVVTSGNDTSDPTPLWQGAMSAGGAGGLVPVQAAAVDHPVAQGWGPYNDYDAATYLTDIPEGVTVVGVAPLIADPDNLVPMVLAAEAPNGRGRWVHIQTRCDVGVTSYDLIDAALSWVTETQDVFGPELAIATQYRPGAIYPDTYQPPAPPDPPVEGDGYVTQDGDHLVTSPGGDWLHTEGT